MKKENIIVLLFIYFFVILCPCYTQKDNYISGKIADIKGEYIYIEFDKIQNIEKGMIFGIYNPDKNPAAICEITKFRGKNSFEAVILVQVEDVKKGYSVLSNIEEESDLRGKIQKDKGEYYDFYKDFTAVRGFADVKQELVEDFLLYQILMEAIEFLKLDINWFQKNNLNNRRKSLLYSEEKIMLDNYRDVIFEGSTFVYFSDLCCIKSKINLGKLKYRLTQQGYSLKPKVIQLVFSSYTIKDDLKAVREIILENSKYVSTEEINSNDVTSPIAFIIYTTPEIFAKEMKSFELKEKDPVITISKVEGDTIEMDAIGHKEDKDSY